MVRLITCTFFIRRIIEYRLIPMLLRISSKGNDVIENEPLESLEKYEKDLENWMAENLNLLFDSYPLWTIHQERPARSEADVIALDDAGNTFIFELKREQADYRSIGQLFNYWTTIAKMEYDELERRAKKYHENDRLDLSFEHFHFFNLKKPIEKEKFNQESRLFVVAEKTNEKLWDIITFLRSRFKIPIAFIKFDVYRLGDELVLHFDTSDASELLDVITGEEESRIEEMYEDRERYFWYNTNKHNLDPPDLHEKTFKLSVAATYGPKIYGDKLAQAKKGDHVFAYANGEGIRAYGKVTQKWNERKVGPEEEAVIRDGNEYHLPTSWEIVLPKEAAIKPDEIRALGYNNFRGTFRRIWNSEFAKKLKEQMELRAHR